MWHSHRKMEKGEKLTKYDSKWDKNVTNVIPNKTRPQKKKKKNQNMLKSLKRKKILGKGYGQWHQKQL